MIDRLIKDEDDNDKEGNDEVLSDEYEYPLDHSSVTITIILHLMI